MTKPISSLRTRVLGIIIGITAGMLVSMALIAIYVVKPRLETKLEKRGQSIAHAISNQCINPLLSRKYFQLDLLFREFITSERDVEYIFVLAPDGEVAAHSFGKEFPVALKEIKPEVDHGGHGTVRFIAAGQSVVDTSVPLLDGSLGRLHVGMSGKSIRDDVNEILLSFGSITLLLCLSSVLYLVVLEKWIIRPIFAIRQTAQKIAMGDYGRRVEVTSRDEIGVLASEFNDMMDSLRRSRENLDRETSLLVKSEERFRAIIRKSPISMAVVSMDGLIEYINDYAVDTFGYLPEEIPHMDDWWQKAYPDAAYREQVIVQWTSLVEKALAGNQYIERHEYQTTCKDGTVKTMLIFGVIISDKVFVVFEDISARKLAEDTVKQINRDLEKTVDERTQELRRINRDLSSFCYAISHELNAPVSRLRGLSQVLLEDWDSNPADAEYCVKRINVASIELQRVIDSVLQLSRLSQSSFAVRRLDLSAMVREIAAGLISEAEDRRIEVVIAENLSAHGDASLVRLCLENLLLNAVKYTSREPVARIEFGRDTESGAFFVRDNGIGFDPANADKVFEPFIRLHAEGEFEGRGIGLATVQRIIERHGGRIRAVSAPGEGATFYFYLSPSDGASNDTCIGTAC